MPLALVRPAVEQPIVPGARHETFNELDRHETIGWVADFAERVTAR